MVTAQMQYADPAPVLAPVLARGPPGTQLLVSLRSRGRACEISQYQAYQDLLAGRAVPENIGRATEFLRLT